ncbi:amidohydrolase family-domain-containing protein [Fusarium acuminatum]|uniref:Amidohydrolase family-domain-containing protein n=1 Tax=Fusarium acuminatum TaxID=5515 RepID=A0ABZ2X6V4_9HYPO
MTTCLQGLHATATHILGGVEQNVLLEELEKLADDAFGKVASPSPESHIFYSSTNPTPIITMKDGKFSAVEAMAIENGKILKVGSLNDAKAVASTVKDPTDIGGNCIVPGFVEPHLHIMTSAMLDKFLLNCDPLNEAIGGTFEGTITFLQQAVKGIKKGSWLLGYGYDPSRLEPHEGSFRDLTPKVFSDNNLNDNPILIINASGHIAYANSPAFSVAGVCEPKSGVLIEPDEYGPLVKKALPSQLIKAGEIIEGLINVVKGWSSKGFTTVFDAGVGSSIPKLDALILSSLGKFAPLRIAGAAANLTPDAAADVVGHGQMPPGGATLLNIKTIKLWMDGSTQGFTGALEEKNKSELLPTYFQHAPYGWARWEVNKTCHITTATPYNIGTEMQKWASRGYQLMVHVNGDCASEVVLDAFEKLHTPDPSIRHRLEHFTVTQSTQVERAAKLNLYASHTIGHVKYWGHTFEKYILGPDRAQRIDPLQDDVKHGLVYSLHSDSPVSQADGLSYVRTAATRLMYDRSSENPGKVLGPEQRVTVEQALAGVTINPARQILLDDKIGSLEEGKDANFVLLSHDVTSPLLDAQGIGSNWVLETWFQGRRRS